MIIETVYLDALTPDYTVAAIKLINRMNWKVKYYNRIMKIAIPEADIPIFNFVFDAI